jgi:cellobiose phosphorylase
MYRLIVESLLGLRLEGETLHIAPCLPADWKTFKLSYRYRETVYQIVVLQLPPGEEGKAAVSNVSVDGVALHGEAISLIDDHLEHLVEVNTYAK